MLALNCLTGADHPLASALSDELFTYDPVGNRLTSHLSASHTHDSANRLLEDDAFTYTYDANGNLIEQRPTTCDSAPALCPTARQFTYDVEHQLIGFATEGTTATYRYDGLGRRIEKDVSGTVTRYVYDAEDVLFTFDGANTLQAGFLHGPGIDQPLLLLPDADRDGTLSLGELRLRLLADGLGSISAVVDDGNGTLLERVQYESFGSPRLLAQDGSPRATSAVGNPYLFTAREYDPESQLIYLRARYYDPRTGRFLQEDPVGLAGGINKYPYVYNNPLTLIDPFGLTSIGGIVGGTALIDPAVDPDAVSFIDPPHEVGPAALVQPVPNQGIQPPGIVDRGVPAGGTRLCETDNAGTIKKRDHAKRRQRERRIPDADIKAALDGPQKSPSRSHPNRVVHYDPVTNTTVVTEGNEIVTVHRGQTSNVQR